MPVWTGFAASEVNLMEIMELRFTPVLGVVFGRFGMRVRYGLPAGLELI